MPKKRWNSQRAPGGWWVDLEELVRDLDKQTDETAKEFEKAKKAVERITPAVSAKVKRKNPSLYRDLELATLVVGSLYDRTMMDSILLQLIVDLYRRLAKAGILVDKGAIGIDKNMKALVAELGMRLH